ncbi:MAG: VIT domain-containing protein [Calditrichaceae bacterium]
MRKLSTIIIILISLSPITEQLYALGTLFSRPRWSNEEYNKMWIKSVAVDIDIQDQIAVTHVDQIFFNEMTTSVEAIYIFPLPENAMITELVYWVNGERYVADIRERQDAINAYNNKLRQWLDPALLEYLGDNLFRLSIVPINAQTEVRTEITYVEALEYNSGLIEYGFLLNTLDLSPKPLETVSLVLNAKTQTIFKSFASPTHKNSSATEIIPVNESHYQLIYGDENFLPDNDLLVQFETVRDYVDMRILTYTPAPEDSFGTESFYMLWVTPPDSLDDEEIIPKSIVFTVDVSSSMEGERLAQVKDALMHFLDLLNPIDRFNIITFGTTVQSFKTNLVPAETPVIVEAKSFVSKLSALGLTNIDAALTTSLSQSYLDSTSNNIIFLTDGNPTWGETDTEIILNNVDTLNDKDTRIFTFGVGEQITKAFLNNLSINNNGYAQFISSNDSIALVVNEQFNRMSKPVLKNVQLDFGALNTRDQYPTIITDLFWGSQITHYGLYNGSGTYAITLNADMRNEPFEFAEMVDFPDTTGGHRFVPRLWAKSKIDHLLDLIEIYGENDEFVNQIIELSLRFQILTKYTAFYSDPDEDDPDDDATDIADEDKTVLKTFSLEQNYPNPFNPKTVIPYQLPDGENAYHVIIKIYDSLGRLVRVLVNESQGPGQYRVTWNSRNDNGELVPSGIYFYRIEAGDQFVKSMKMVLLR